VGEPLTTTVSLAATEVGVPNPGGGRADRAGQGTGHPAPPTPRRARPPRRRRRGAWVQSSL